MKITLRWEHERHPGDKTASVVAEQNDGWNDLRIWIDTDDCNQDFAVKAMQHVIDTVNAANTEAST